MSNRFDDDDFKFDDDDFGDEKFDLDNDFGRDLEDEDLPPLEEEETSTSRGPSRTFIAIAGIFILLFVVGLVALVLIVSNQGPAPAALTATAESGTIIAANATTFANATETAIALEQFNLQQTQVAFGLTQTALVPPTATPSLTPTPTETPTPTQDPALAALIAQQTQAAQTAAAQALTGVPSPLPSPSPTAQGVPADAVAQTATALANLLQQPTREIVVPTPEVAVTVPPTALPDTGLFDDVLTGGVSSLGTIALAGLALIGVIVASRWLRASNR